jgi:hypothetical protein
MIVVKIAGGLGNQLFEYAYGLALSRRIKTELYCDISNFKNTNYPAQLELRRLFPQQIKHSSKVNLLKYVRRVQETQFHYEHRLYCVGDFHYIDGRFQSEQYFYDIKDEMKALFQSDHYDWVRQKVNEMGCDCAIHIRHGDFITCPISYVLPLSYYNNAMEQIDGKRFVVFSDDLGYANMFTNKVKDAGFDCKVWKPIDSIHDMAAMSFFPKIIAANSTFSYWAAYTSKAKVIVPKQYFANNINKDMSDFYPSNWIQI